jgi:hypothetical protein
MALTVGGALVVAALFALVVSRRRKPNAAAPSE